MKFVKMQGLGNDYVFVDCFTQRLPQPESDLAIRMSDRHTGVGSDGLILIEPSQKCDVKMRMFNSDGSEGAMCGNGIRCLGKYVYDSGIRRGDVISVETKAGVKMINPIVENGVCSGARVDMGVCLVDKDDVKLVAADKEWTLRKADMGNPHAVCFLTELPNDKLFYAAGPELEKNPAFPDRANIEFCRADSRRHVTVRVWERGSGETLACGTGACASACTGFTMGLLDEKCTVSMPGGDLEIEVLNNGQIYMTGPAAVCFTGVWER